MKKLVFYPFLFTVFPILELFFKASSEIPFIETLRILIAAPIVTGLGMLLVYWWSRDWERAGFVVTIFLFIFFYYGSFYYVAWNLTFFGVRIGKHEILFPLWTMMLFILGSRWAWDRLQAGSLITKFLNITVTVTLLFSVGRYLLKVNRTQGLLREAPALPRVSLVHEEQFQLQSEQTPDIYYIILDSYAREDVLAQLYGLDG